MELHLYIDILRRHWRIVLAVPLLVALLSLAVALSRPPIYGVQSRLLVTRDNANTSAVGRTAAGEDTTAEDLPAILDSAIFRHDLAQALAQRGQPVDERSLVGMISASANLEQVATTVADTSPERAAAVANAMIVVLQTNGLRYWGDPSATQQQPGLHVGVLDPPAQAVRLNGPRSFALEVTLRTFASLGAAIGLVFLLDYRQRRRIVMRNAL